MVDQSFKHLYDRPIQHPVPPGSYTAIRLKYASPKHLNLTSRRLFIGPDLGDSPTWLKSTKSIHERQQQRVSTVLHEYTVADAPGVPATASRLDGTGSSGPAAPTPQPFPQPADLNGPEDPQEGSSSRPATLADFRQKASIEILQSTTSDSPPSRQATPDEPVTSEAAPLLRKIGRVKTKSAASKARTAPAFHYSTFPSTAQEVLPEQILRVGKMLVRVDETEPMEIPRNYIESTSFRVPLRSRGMWHENMIVLRRQQVGAGEQDGKSALYFYDTRVIPDAEDIGETVKKEHWWRTRKHRFKHRVVLHPEFSQIKLYSPLDKTISICAPGGREGRWKIMILNPLTMAEGSEWLTLIWTTLGWTIPPSIKISVPSFRTNVTISDLAVDAGVGGLPSPAKLKEMVLEVLSLGKDMNWPEVLQGLLENKCQFALAWKFYDRLEWASLGTGHNFGKSFALIESHNLELRQLYHYPTTVNLPSDDPEEDTEEEIEEPLPLEGFLTRLTFDDGADTRFYRTCSRYAYCTVFNQYLLFLHPKDAIPPKIPAGHARSSLDTFEVDPYPVDENGSISWLNGSSDNASTGDQDACWEWGRCCHNLRRANAMINLCSVDKICSPTNTHEEAPIFELHLETGIRIRLMAGSQKARDGWANGLRDLARYWKLRLSSDTIVSTTVRAANMMRNSNPKMIAESATASKASHWDMIKGTASSCVWNMCRTLACRPVFMSGTLYVTNNPTTSRQLYPAMDKYAVILAAGHIYLFRAHVRHISGVRKSHIFMPKSRKISLADCYLITGRLAETREFCRTSDTSENQNIALEYRISPDTEALDAPNRSFLPRVWRHDGALCTDDETSTTFAIWRNTARKGFFRSKIRRKKCENEPAGNDTVAAEADPHSGDDAGTVEETRIKMVSRLGLQGQADVFIAHSRTERDQWVMAINYEVDRIRSAALNRGKPEEEVRFYDR